MSDPLEIDQWISQLSQCKQLAESDVKVLCDKAGLYLCTKHVKFIYHSSLDQRNTHGGVQCTASAVSGHSLR